jgi:hypothetical protein
MNIEIDELMMIHSCLYKYDEDDDDDDKCHDDCNDDGDDNDE